MSVSDVATAARPSSAEDLVALIERRAGRAAKAILRYKDTHVDPHLPDGVSGELRKIVLDEVNDLADTAKDLLAALAARSDEQVVVNQLWLERLEEIHKHVVPRE